MSMIPLLVHSDVISEKARHALRAVIAAPKDERVPLRHAAALVLFEETELECDEVLDLVGLDRDQVRC